MFKKINAFVRLSRIIKIRPKSFGHYHIKDAGPHMQFSYQPVTLTTHFEAHLGLPSPLMDLHHSNSQCSLKARCASSKKGWNFCYIVRLCYLGTYFSFLFFSFLFLFYFIFYGTFTLLECKILCSLFRFPLCNWNQ